MLTLYTFTKPGKDLGNADALSRLPQPQTTDANCQPAELIHLLQHLSSTGINATSIRRWTDTHPILLKIRQFILQGWSNNQLDKEFQPYSKRKAELWLYFMGNQSCCSTKRQKICFTRTS